MPNTLAAIALSIIFMHAVAGMASADTSTLAWETLPELPGTKGFAGAYAGVSNGALIVAGGTNFVATTPDGKKEKTWYDTIYVLESPDSAWRTGEKLPRPLGYGLSIVTPEGLICVGGCDKDKNYADVFMLKWNGETIETVAMPPLPQPVSCAAGALVGNTIYVAGGQPGPNPFSGPSMHNFWSLDLTESEPKWRVLKPWPGVERFYAVGASDGKSFYMISGLRKVEDGNGKPALEYLKDAYRYDTPTDGSTGGWQRIADLPRANAAAASPAPVIDGHVLLLGNGADGANLDLPVSERPGFGKQLLRYDIAADHWESAGTAPVGRAAVTAVKWNDLWVLPTGEVRPMVRSPQIHAARVIR